MKQWEVTWNRDEEILERTLNQMTQEGWEVYSILLNPVRYKDKDGDYLTNGFTTIFYREGL